MTWEVKNHGGNPTTNEDNKYAIFIGRFQPYHGRHPVRTVRGGVGAAVQVAARPARPPPIPPLLGGAGDSPPRTRPLVKY
jgi:hypothetical protein